MASTHEAHEPLIGDDDFAQAQQQLARRARINTTPHKPHHSRHSYVFKA